MWIKHLYLQNFRNYPRLSLPLDPGFNIFVGDNAQGKTNLLEAMYVLAAGRSFRGSRDQELILQGQKSARAAAKIVRDAEIRLDLLLDADTPKKFLVNGKATRTGYFRGKLNVVLFTPDDLQLIKGGPAGRRNFLDEEISQVSPVYGDLIVQYQKILSQRNRLLKEYRSQNSSSKDVIAVFNSQLLDTGSRIIEKRSAAVHRLSLLSRLMHRKMTAGREELVLAYTPFFAKHPLRRELGLSEIRANFSEAMASREAKEFERGYSLIGPQRDDLVFFIDDKDGRLYGSQGQQRTAVLACRLAEMEYMRSETGMYPVILLDDVMSELDPQRRSFLTNILQQQVQTIITTTHLGSFGPSILNRANVLRIERGEVIL